MSSHTILINFMVASSPGSTQLEPGDKADNSYYNAVHLFAQHTQYYYTAHLVWKGVWMYHCKRCVEKILIPYYRYLR